MSLPWVKSWKTDLVGSLNFQQLSASLKAFYSLLRDYVRDDEWCGGLCYPNGKPISGKEFAHIIKGKPYLIEQYFADLLIVGMVYKDKNKILCLRKYALKILMADKKCEKCAQNHLGECILIGDYPNLPLLLPCYNSATTPSQDCDNNDTRVSQGYDNSATTLTRQEIQPIDNKGVIESEKHRTEAETYSEAEAEKKEIPPPLDADDRIALDLAQQHRTNCKEGKMEWAKDVFFSAIKRGIKGLTIQSMITKNPGVPAKDIIRMIEGGKDGTANNSQRQGGGGKVKIEKLGDYARGVEYYDR